MELKFREYCFAITPTRNPKSLNKIGKRTIISLHLQEYGSNDFSSTTFTLSDERENKN